MNAADHKNWEKVGSFAFDPEALTRASREKEGKATISASPYDVPSRLTAWNQNQQIQIRWHYITSDETTQTHLHNTFKMEVGQNTGRLYRLTVLTDRHQAENLKALLQEALQKLPATTSAKHKEVLLLGIDHLQPALQQTLAPHMDTPADGRSP